MFLSQTNNILFSLYAIEIKKLFVKKNILQFYLWQLKFKNSLCKQLFIQIEKINLITLNKKFISNFKKKYQGFFLEIHPVIGGEESENWSLMLMNIYKKWFAKRKIEFDIVSISISNSGIRSVIFKIYKNEILYLLRKEMGLHKLVRISPFDNKKKRHTSISEVFVYPKVKEQQNSKIKPCNFKVETFKSSGAGGQHVNTTDSAIRIKHIPSNLTVQCQNHRSQHKNRKECFSILESKLCMYYKKNIDEERRCELNIFKQYVRSYTLHPYKLVRDYKSGTYTFNTHSVLCGNIDAFLYS